MTGPRYGIRFGEGTGKYVDVRVMVSVGSDGCKVVVEHERGGPAHVEVAGHEEAGRIAGETVAHLVNEAVSGFRKSESLE